MSLTIEVPGFEKQKIELKAGAFSNSLLVNGQPAVKKEGSKNEYLVEDDQGQQQLFTLKGQSVDLPLVQFNGESYYFAPPVGLGSKILIGVLLIPLFAGGAIGGGLAGAGFVMAMSAFRTEKPGWLQHLTAVGIALGAWFIYLLLAGGITAMIG